MAWRALVLLAVAAGAGASAAAAQGVATSPAALSLAAYGGWSLDYTIPMRSVSLVSGEATERDLELGGRTTFGLEATRPLSDRVVGIAGWRYETESTCTAPESSAQPCPEELATQGPSSVFQLGLGLVLGGRSSMTLHAGATYSTGDTHASDIGLLFGAFIDVPVAGPHLALRVGVDDRLAFWEEDDAFVDISGSLERGPSHVVGLRAGLALRP